MCYFLLGFFLITLFSGLVFYESIRWVSIQEECKLTRENHQKLLTSDVCKRNGFGEGVEAICNKASIELRTNIYICTSMEWWKRGEIYHLYMKLTESYISLLSLILVPVIFIIYMIFDSIKQRDIDSRVERLISQREIPHPPQYLMLPPVQEDRGGDRRRRSQFISDPRDY